MRKVYSNGKVAVK